jgi:hypothetical protein
MKKIKRKLLKEGSSPNVDMKKITMMGVLLTKIKK